MPVEAGGRRHLIALACLLAAIAGCSSAPEDNDSAPINAADVKLTKAQRAHIQLYTVVPVGYRQRIEAPGTVDFDNDQATSVVSPFTGPVTRILVALGQSVGRGQPLAVVQSADYATAVGAYRKAVVAAANAQRLAAADRDLAAHNGISQREAAQAQTDAASATADRQSALQSLLAMGVDRGTIARATAGNPAAGFAGVIRAPVSGTVVEKQITPGQLLQSGTSAAFTVANLSQVWVLAQINSSDLSSVHPGDSATIDPRNGTGPFHGTVQNVAASVDPDTRAVVARIVAPNPGDLLKKQMYVDVLLESGRVSTGLLVPVSAVLRDDENMPFVYAMQPDGSFVRRHVTLGYRDSQNYEVTTGLASGDKVVANGALFLQFMQSQ
ncbi:efflux RND transporter periplasmic adaptor subunit [Sphingomonas sp.]|uniref:efflux RND transporter periplasmic adaptor subunit n=1 Tax=Sphingomonas sp. TaxID=28214 RepID=UPI0025EEC647|nr:efflux RND transporter periplasmic adaptor subunit [Sphingomonas sp.]MBV9528641.1 efflux RND transporter periplasmic adaptor subunit [Sphingomonas sp.]